MVLPLPAPLNAADRAWATLIENITNDRFTDAVQSAQELYTLASQGVFPHIRFLGHRTKQLPTVIVTLSDDARQALRRTPPKKLILAPKRVIDLDADESGYAQIDGHYYLVTGHGVRRRSSAGTIEEVKRRLQLPTDAYNIPWLRDWMADKHDGYLWSIDAATPGQHLEEQDELVIGSFVIQRQETDEGVRFIMGIEDGGSLRDVVTLSSPRATSRTAPAPPNDANDRAYAQVVDRIIQDVMPALLQEGAIPSGDDDTQAMRVLHTIGPAMLAAINNRSSTDPAQQLLTFVRHAVRTTMADATAKVMAVADQLGQLTGRPLSAEDADRLRQQLLDAVLPVLPQNLGARDGDLDGFDPLEMDDDFTLGSRKYSDLAPAHQRLVNDLITTLTPAVEAHLLDPQFTKLLTEPTRGVADATAFMVEKVLADLARKEAGEKETQLDRVRQLINQAWDERKYAHVRDATVGQMFQRLGVGREALRVKGTNAMRVLGKVFQKLADTIRASVEASEGQPSAEQPDWWPSTAEWPQRTAAGPDDSDIRF